MINKGLKPISALYRWAVNAVFVDDNPARKVERPTGREVVIAPATEGAGRGRVIPMTPALFDLYPDLRSRRPLPALDGSDRVFLGPDGSPLKVGSLRG